MVQDEVSSPALRQTVMTTNCGDTNCIKPRPTPFSTKMGHGKCITQFSLLIFFIFFTRCNTGKDQQTKWKGTRRGSMNDAYSQKCDNAWLRHLKCLTRKRWLSRRLVHSLCKPCCLRGDSLEFFRCQKLYLWRESTTEAFSAKYVSFQLFGFIQSSIRWSKE